MKKIHNQLVLYIFIYKIVFLCIINNLKIRKSKTRYGQTRRKIGMESLKSNQRLPR